MKQAILITAYKDLVFITQIISYFDSDFTFFIHIDKKCQEDFSVLKKYNNVFLYNRYRIEWGGSNHLMAIFLLIQEAHKSQQFDYFHLITGSDYPIKPLSEFKLFFETNKNKNFMEYFQLPRRNWWKNGGLNRIQYFWFGLNNLDIRGKYSKLIRLPARVQKKFILKRKFGFFSERLLGGSTYWSLSKNAINVFISFVDNNPKFIKRFRFTCIAEEIFMQTILINLNVSVNNNSLHYIDWGENQSSPKTLSENDFDKLMSSDCFFARKFDLIISEKLLKKIRKSNFNTIS